MLETKQLTRVYTLPVIKASD